MTISRAPIAEVEAFRPRMDWRFRWLSSCASDFNFDYGVSLTQEELAEGEPIYNYGSSRFLSEEASGLSVFCREQNKDIFHTYSTFGRGDEMVDTAYMYLELTPKGATRLAPAITSPIGSGIMIDTVRLPSSLAMDVSSRAKPRILYAAVSPSKSHRVAI